MAPVQISGISAICGSGLTKEQIFATCRQGVTSVGNDGLSTIPAMAIQELALGTPETLRGSKSTVLSYHAFSAALKDSGWSTQELQDSGLILASTTSQIDQWENILPLHAEGKSNANDPHTAVGSQSLGKPLLTLAEHFKIQGPQNLIASSCSASLQAIALASLWLRAGKIRRCIVGATEIHSNLTTHGFGALRLLAKNNSAPFDKNRAGINLGEGSAFLFLEAGNKGKWGQVAGFGLSTDAHHVTSPHPEGAGSQIAMRMALRNASLEPSAIDWIYAHGTGSPANDLSESIAIGRIFSHQPPVTSTKTVHGHTLAASGAVESVIGLMAMKNGVSLPTLGFVEKAPGMDIHVESSCRPISLRHFLKNSLGFGGINASVIFSAAAPV